MQALIDELKKPEYQGKTDQQAADMVNAKTVTVRRPVELWQVHEHSCRKGYRAQLEIAAANPNHPCRLVAINILAYLDSPRMLTLDMDDPDTRQALEAMEPCEFATLQDIAELIAFGDHTIPWVDHNNLGVVGVGAIYNARREID